MSRNSDKAAKLWKRMALVKATQHMVLDHIQRGIRSELLLHDVDALEEIERELLDELRKLGELSFGPTLAARGDPWLQNRLAEKHRAKRAKASEEQPA